MMVAEVVSDAFTAIPAGYLVVEVVVVEVPILRASSRFQAEVMIASRRIIAVLIIEVAAIVSWIVEIRLDSCLDNFHIAMQFIDNGKSLKCRNQ